MTSSKPSYSNRLDGKDNRARGATANALFTKQENGNCAFCLGNHAQENCQRVARCFKCKKKGHRARDCKIDVLCNNCGPAGHHVCLCDVRNAQQVPPVAEYQFSPNGQDKTPIVTSPSSLHVGTGERVALQTAHAVIRGVGKPYRVRVLFDTGSHRSFITSKAAQCVKLASIRREWLGIITFGQCSEDMHLRDVVEVKVSPTDGQKVIPIEVVHGPGPQI